MFHRQSVKYKLLVGFILVMIPVVTYMLINNSNSRDLVRVKVSETYSNTLTIFTGQIDHYLRQIDDYLYKMGVLDADIGLLTSYPVSSNDYTLTKVRIDAKLNRDVGVYNLVDTVFLYQEEDIIFGTESVYNDTYKLITEHMEKSPYKTEMYQYGKSNWQLGESDRIAGRYFLINYIKVTDDLFFGAIVTIQDIHDLLLIQWNDGDIGFTDIFSVENDQLTDVLTAYSSLEGESSSEIIDANASEYVLLEQRSGVADMAYRLAIPEKTIMRELLFFRNATFVAPIFFFVILALYILYMQRMLFKPLHELMLGMKKVSLGNLEVRLHRNNTIEFDFLANTFNDMAEQVKNLKIDVYEEQLRVKQGELKQLQSQINPHFYMNSLNIIYNFAVLEEMDSVKKMSLHLADYFRFIMTSNRDMITFKEELKHIENYITIQQLRFPNRLEMTIENIDPFLNYPIAALTIQPFVENAIIHGFKNRKQIFKITIAAHQKSDQSFIIKISDNGTGFPEDVLAKLRRHESIEEGQRTSLGIMNVKNRLELLYGKLATIQFSNLTEESGAVIEIHFPIQEELK
ncbi:MAG: histidine kinase [Candidatus Pristimantibacillus lignocellulolyticus]|uniref:Histidine kinase n=1 Tax=Candidatus Pristimantibacillus lignocellulolyticus TaxID=2994561 RepID=A0A9J6Z9G3_9BACL|nr:MAG: histidine kinase [Candidatus Pristimantibacillus lignocellulolyticus]